MTFLNRKRTNRGFTLPEVMVAMALLSGLLVALVLIYQAGLTEYSHASGRITMQTKSRLIMDKLVYYLSTASEPDDTTFTLGPVPYPQQDNDSDGLLDTVQEVRFVSFANLLADGALPSDAGVNFRQPPPRFFRVFVDTADQFSPIVLQETTTYNGTVNLNAQPGRVLGNNVLDVRFSRPADSVVQVQLTLSNFNATTGRFSTGDIMHRYQGAPRSNVNAYVLDSAIQLPVFSL